MARRTLHDAYFKQAKREGYAARSAYKLTEIDDRKRLLRRGAWVLDLGCAPGAWLQVAGERVGARGVVVGIDLQEVRGSFGATVVALQGDIFETPASRLLEAACEAGAAEPGEGEGAGRRFDVVLSDMAPKTSGDPRSDHFLSARLCDRVLDLCPALVEEGGSLAMKVFEGEAYPDLLERTRGLFADVKGFKPKASRDASREMYVIGKGFRG
jgi:23S rRNA (uridine2552-2'-O)-methyltransferase